jgi:hypothetical protein
MRKVGAPLGQRVAHRCAKFAPRGPATTPTDGARGATIDVGSGRDARGERDARPRGGGRRPGHRVGDPRGIEAGPHEPSLVARGARSQR